MRVSTHTAVMLLHRVVAWTDVNHGGVGTDRHQSGPGGDWYRWVNHERV